MKFTIDKKLINYYLNESTNASSGAKTTIAAGATGLVGLKAASKLGMLGKLGGAAKLGGVALKAAKSGGALYIPGGTAAGAALRSGIGSAAGTALINGGAALAGSGVPPTAIGIASAAAGVKGGLLGGIMHKTRDSLLMNTAIPAAVVGATAPLTDAAFEYFEQPAKVDVPMSMGITAGVGGLGWYLRNRKSPNKKYI